MDRSFKAVLIVAHDPRFDDPTIVSTSFRLNKIKEVLAKEGILFDFAEPVSIEGHFVLRIGTHFVSRIDI